MKPKFSLICTSITYSLLGKCGNIHLGEPLMIFGRRIPAPAVGGLDRGRELSPPIARHGRANREESGSKKGAAIVMGGMERLIGAPMRERIGFEIEKNDIKCSCVFQCFLL